MSEMRVSGSCLGRLQTGGTCSASRLLGRSHVPGHAQPGSRCQGRTIHTTLGT